MSTTLNLKIRLDAHDDFGSASFGLLGGTTVQDGKPIGFNMRAFYFFDRDTGGSAFTLPKNSTIVSATIIRNPSDTANPAGLNYKLHCEAADTPAVPASGSALDSVALTTAFVNITSANTTVGVDNNMDVTAPVQELVTRAGYCETIVSIIAVNNGGADSVRWNSREASTTLCPRLTIVYDPPAAGGPFPHHTRRLLTGGMPVGGGMC